MQRLEVFDRRAAEFDGEVVNHTGDGCLVLFDSVSEAVRYAVEVQGALTALDDAMAGEPAMAFRIGVNAGDIIVEDDRVFGDSINVAARVQALAPPGAVCITRAVYDQVRLRLDYAYDFLGTHQLKNIAESVETWTVGTTDAGVVAKPSVRPAPPTGDDLWQQLLSRPSVAVMPFENRSADPDHAFFTDGLTEDVIHNLSRFRGLSVIARASVFVLRQSALPIEEIARRLGVRYVVEGSVRRGGKRIRVNVSLTDAIERQSVWSEQYDRQVDDLFEVEDDITATVTSAMAVQIEAAERERLRTIVPPSLSAYGYILQGQYHLFRYTSESNASARDFYMHGIEISPKYARALAALSRTHNLDWRYGWSAAPDNSLDMAYRCAQDAVAADPNDARGHAELGYVRLYRKQHEAAIDAYKRAVSLNPSDANIIMEYADTLAHSGFGEEGVELFQRAMRLNPYYPDDYLWGLGGAYFKLGRYDDAIEAIRRMNNPAQGRRILTAALALSGNLDEARVQAEMVRQSHPGFDAEKWVMVVPDKNREDSLRFVEGLRKAGL